MPENNNLAIVFSDIVGSSNLYASLGNLRAKVKIDEAINTMRELVTENEGRVIKTIGDEIMFAHVDPDRACETAAHINIELKRHHFYLRTGISYGRVIEETQDVYGDTVNIAAFLASTAQSNLILLDSNTFANLAMMRSQCEYFDRITLKGQTEPSLVYRLNWEQSDTQTLDSTLVSSKAREIEGTPTQLLVNFEGHTYYVNPATGICVGRDHGSVQIWVKNKSASRRHCTLAYRRGKFVLEDHSTNGTYLLQQGNREVFIKRETIPLFADGKISIGQPCRLSDSVLDYHLD